MNNKRKRIILSVAIFFIVMIGVGAMLAWNSPLLGKQMPQFETSTQVSPTENEHNVISSASGNQDLLNVGATPTSENSHNLSDQQPVCSGQENMNVLVLVIDDQAQADVIRLIHINFFDGRVDFTAIPRDFYITIVDMADNGITQGRINATFGYGEKFNGSGEGIFSLARNITENFGISFDRYVVLNKRKIDKYVDFVGGVDIFLEKPVADDSRFFPAGDVHLDGKDAIDFLSIRYFDDDFHRIRRQNVFIKNFFHKVMNELTLAQQTQLAMTMLLDKSIQTDFTAKDVPSMLCLARAIDREKIQFIEIPSEMYHPATTTSGGNVQIPHDTVAPFLQSIMSGQYQP